MLRAKDYLLIVVSFFAIFTSVAFPKSGALFAPFPKYCMNNVLVMVLSAAFFRPLEPTVTAVYTIPFYGLIIPLRLYQNLQIKRCTSETRRPLR